MRAEGSRSDAKIRSPPAADLFYGPQSGRRVLGEWYHQRGLLLTENTGASATTSLADGTGRGN